MRTLSTNELEKLMAHDGYKRIRGALRQTRHAPSEGMPDYCHGCAWVDSFGGCMVFVDAWNAWISNDNCEAYAIEEERDAIELAITEYAGQGHRGDVPEGGDMEV